MSTTTTEVGPIRYRKTDDQTYLATCADGRSCTVAYGWLRTGGWQWIVVTTGDRLWITGTTRDAAARKALLAQEVSA